MSCTFLEITIWSLRAYGCSLSQLLFHLQLYSYISRTSLFENIVHLFFGILLEPTFVCSCRDLSGTHTAAANIHNNNSRPEGPGGRRAALPLHDLSLENQPNSSPSFISIPSIFSSSGFQSDMLHCSRTEVVME